MAESDGKRLRGLFEKFEMTWFLESFPSDPDTLMARFDDFADAYKAKLETVEVPDGVTAHASVDLLLDIADRHPLRAEAFLQVFASSASQEMLAMAWLVQQEANVSEISFDFEQRERFDLRIDVKLGRNGAPVSFHTHSVFDMAVLRHFGTMKAGKRPLITGFYPLRNRGASLNPKSGD